MSRREPTAAEQMNIEARLKAVQAALAVQANAIGDLIVALAPLVARAVRAREMCTGFPSAGGGTFHCDTCIDNRESGARSERHEEGSTEGGGQ